jgi:hypothetical protein
VFGAFLVKKINLLTYLIPTNGGRHPDKWGEIEGG